jgi:hypothetical protein
MTKAGNLLSMHAVFELSGSDCCAAVQLYTPDVDACPTLPRVFANIFVNPHLDDRTGINLAQRIRWGVGMGPLGSPKKFLTNNGKLREISPGLASEQIIPIAPLIEE